MARSLYQEIGWLVDRTLDPFARIALQLMLPILMDKEPVTMADITQALSDLNDAVSGVADRAAADHADLQQQIDTLKAQGTDTTQLQQIADNLESHVASLNAIDVPAAPAAPAPEQPAPATPDAPAAPVDTPAPAVDNPGASASTPVTDAPASDAPAVPAPTAGGASDASGTVTGGDAPVAPTDAPVSDGTAGA